MPHVLIEVGQGLAIIYLMYKQNSHLAEANRIMREQHGLATSETASRWKRVGHYWPLMTMGVIAIASWIPYFLSTPQKDVLTNYGGEADANGFRIYSQVDRQRIGET